MPKSSGPVLIWRRSTARMVPLAMGTSSDLPVRLSVMVRVSRDLEAASGLTELVVVEPGELIKKTSSQTRDTKGEEGGKERGKWALERRKQRGEGSGPGA